MRKKAAASVICVLLTVPVCRAAGPKLADERRVFPKAEPAWKRPAQSSLWAMRLSPDGKNVLYTRPKGEQAGRPGGAEGGDRASYEVVLRRLASGKETVLPIPPLKRGWRTVFTRFDCFDRAGRRLILASIKSEQRTVGEAAQAVRTSMELLIFDVASGKSSPTGVRGARVFGKFDRSGRGLIVMEDMRVCRAAPPKYELKPTGLLGLLQSVCPAADVVCALAMPAKPREMGRRMRPALVLFDIRARRQIAKLPMHERNRKLDDWESQWTADGRYLCYYDVEEEDADAAGGRRKRLKAFTRVWDRVAGKEAGRIGEAVALGPGPTPTTMVLAKRGTAGYERLLLHDAATGGEWVLGDGRLAPIHAAGKTVLYVKALPDGVEAAHVARIAWPGGKGEHGQDQER